MQTSWPRRFETVGERSARNELLSSLSLVLAIYFSAKVSAQQSGKTHARLVAAKLYGKKRGIALAFYIFRVGLLSAELFSPRRRGTIPLNMQGCGCVQASSWPRRYEKKEENSRPGEQSAWRVAFCASHPSAKKSTKRRVNMSLRGIALILHLCAAATRVRLFFENGENNQSRRHCSSSTPLVPATRAWFCFEIQEKSKRVLHAKC